MKVITVVDGTPDIIQQWLEHIKIFGERYPGSFKIIAAVQDHNRSREEIIRAIDGDDHD